jgi:hypothetical protein
MYGELLNMEEHSYTSHRTMVPMVGTILSLLAAFAAAPIAQVEGETTDVSSSLSISARLELSVPGGPRGLLQTDIDGDGADELVVITELPGRIHIWRGLRPGFTVMAKPLIAQIPDYCLGPEILADNTLVLASRTDQELLLCFIPSDLFEARKLQDTSSLTFAPEELRVPLGAIPRALHTGKTSWSGERIAVVTEADELLILDGVNVESRTPLIDSLPTSVAFAPGGVIVASQGSPSLVFYAATSPSTEGGMTSFSPAAELKLSGIPRDIAVLDLDQDGDQELICLLGSRTAFVLGFQNKDGLKPWFAKEGETPQAVEWTTGALPIDLATCDLTGDGFDELIATHLSDQVISVLGDFSIDGPKQTNPLHGGAGPWRSEVGDLNGDGAPDLAIANPQGSAISLFFGSESESKLGGFQGAPHHAAVPVPHSMTAGDFNGDGCDDVAMLSAWDNSLGLLYGSPEAAVGFLPLQTVGAPPESDELATGDLDGDGQDDVVMLVQTPLGTKLFALTLSAAGNLDASATPESDRWRRLHSTAADCREGAAILLVDFDGDQRDEILVADSAGLKLIVYTLGENDELIALANLALDAAPGSLAPIYGTSKSNDVIHLKGIAVGLIGEAGPGIGLLSIATPEQAKSALLAGSAPLTLVGVLPAPRPIKDLVGADMDGDGFTDIAVLMQGATDNHPGGVVIALAPNASGRTSWVNLPPLLAGPKAFHLLARDLNGDLASELFVSSQYAYRVDSWVGVPGRSPAPGWRLGAHRGCMDMAFADINGDGFVELVVSNNHSSDISVLRLEK